MILIKQTSLLLNFQMKMSWFSLRTASMLRAVAALPCWLKNTGFCVMDDSLKHAGALIGQSDPLIIINRLCYGGYSPGVKAVLDRAIGVSLPFFTWRGGQTHHIGRYPQRKLLRVLFYGDSTESERQTATELAERNRLNLGYKTAETLFFQNPAQIRGAIS